MPRKRNRSPSEILAGLQAKARAQIEKETMIEIVHPVRCNVQRCVETAKPAIVIVRDIRRADGGIQTQSLNHDGVWEDREEGFGESNGRDLHILR